MSGRAVESSAGDGWLTAGYVARAHGVRGALRMVLLGDAECFVGLSALRLCPPRGAAEAFAVAGLRPVHGAYLVELEGIDDRDAAQRLVGARVEARRSEVPAPAPGEFYLFELVGLAATDAAGALLGAVAAVHDRPGQALIELTPRPGDAAHDGGRLLPLAPGVVQQVDRAAGRVTLHVPDGLWDV